MLDILGPEQNDRYFSDSIFKCRLLKGTEYFEFQFTDVGSQGHDWQYVSLGSGHGLAPNKQWAKVK